MKANGVRLTYVTEKPLLRRNIAMVSAWQTLSSPLNCNVSAVPGWTASRGVSFAQFGCCTFPFVKRRALITPCTSRLIRIPLFFSNGLLCFLGVGICGLASHFAEAGICDSSVTENSSIHSYLFIHFSFKRKKKDL